MEVTFGDDSAVSGKVCLTGLVAEVVTGESIGVGDEEDDAEEELDEIVIGSVVLILVPG